MENFEQMVARVKASAFIPSDLGEIEMAKKIDAPIQFSTSGNGGFGRRYDWDSWLKLSDKPNYDVNGTLVKSGDTLLLEQSKGERDVLGKDKKPLPRSKQSVVKATETLDFETSVDLMINRLRVRGWKDYLVCMISKVDQDGRKLKDAIIIKYREMTPAEKVAENERRKEAAKRAVERAENGDDEDDEEEDEPVAANPKPTVAANSPTPAAKQQQPPKKAGNAK